MSRKRITVLFIIFSVILVFSACSTSESSANETTALTDVSTREALASTTIGQTDTEIITSSPKEAETDSSVTVESAATTTSDITKTTTAVSEDSTTAITTDAGLIEEALNPEEIEKLPDYPSYYFVWALDEEGIANAAENPETIEYFTYDGKPVTVFCQLLNASSKAWEFGLFVEVDGVLQKTELNGKAYELHRIELQPLESRTVKMTFVPNVGEKSDIRSLSCAVLVSPSYVSEEDGDYGIYLEPAISGNFPLVMYADSTKGADIADDPSLYKVSSVNRTIYSVYEEGNNLETFEYYPCCYIYENFNSYIKKEHGSFIRNTRITTKASENSKLIINLHGKSGTYRLSLYLNGERINVFDGKGYIDITIGEKQQAEIPIVIDTRMLKGANRLEAYYKELNCDFTQENSIIFSSGPQKYIVK